MNPVIKTLCFLGAAAYAILIANIFGFLLHLLTPFVLSWTWSVVTAVLIFGGGTLFALFFMFSGLVGMPFAYMCFNKWTRILPVLIFAAHAVSNVAYPWLLHPQHFAVFNALVLNTLTLTIFGALIFATVAAEYDD